MSKEKQIEEMARIICRDYNGGICATDGFVCNYNCEWTQIAKHLYNAGYRKQSENAIEFPCKVGDKAWFVFTLRFPAKPSDKGKWFMVEDGVQRLIYGAKGVSIETWNMGTKSSFSRKKKRKRYLRK